MVSGECVISGGRGYLAKQILDLPVSNTMDMDDSAAWVLQICPWISVFIRDPGWIELPSKHGENPAMMVPFISPMAHRPTGASSSFLALSLGFAFPFA